MKILIETDGTGSGTKIFLNDVRQENLCEFNLSINKNVKLQMIRIVEGKPMPISYFKGDFKKFDEYLPIK